MKVKEVNSYLRERGLTLGSVESFTGGLFAQQITSVSGASKFYKGGYITYATEEKVNLLFIVVTSIQFYFPLPLDTCLSKLWIYLGL